MRALRALPSAFFGSLAWFLWTTKGQSTAACFDYSHYVPSAAIALLVIVCFAVALDLYVVSRPQRPDRSALVASAVGAASLTTIGLAAAVFFSAVISCTGG